MDIKIEVTPEFLENDYQMIRHKLWCFISDNMIGLDEAEMIIHELMEEAYNANT